jgi:hypothetical protein
MSIFIKLTLERTYCNVLILVTMLSLCRQKAIVLLALFDFSVCTERSVSEDTRQKAMHSMRTILCRFQFITRVNCR